MIVNDLIDNVILLKFFQYFEIIFHVQLMKLNNVLMDVNIIVHQVQVDL
jgi:hypothetical protein